MRNSQPLRQPGLLQKGCRPFPKMRDTAFAVPQMFLNLHFICQKCSRDCVFATYHALQLFAFPLKKIFPGLWKFPQNHDTLH